MLKVIELFAGIGSQTQALKNIGIEHQVVAISDNDKFADRSYRALHDNTVVNLGDIRSIAQLPPADLWTYSFPCQDVSVAGHGKGLDKGGGTRSGLLWEVERLLLKAKETATLPKYLLLENVKNLIGKKHKDNYDKWLSFLMGLGYTTYTKVLNAKHYGVPQNRERVFGVSILGEHVPFVFPSPQELKVRLKDILETEPDTKFFLKESTINSILTSTFNSRRDNIYGDNDICGSLLSRDFKEPKCVVAGQLVEGKWKKTLKQHQRVYSTDGIAPTLTSNAGGNQEKKIVVDEPKCIVAGQMQGGKWDKTYNQSKMGYDPRGIAPTQMAGAGEGGNNETKIIVDDLYSQRQPRQYEDTAPTLRGERSGLKVLAFRGRNPDNPSDRTPGVKCQQRLEERSDDLTNALTTCQKDNLVLQIEKGSTVRDGYKEFAEQKGYIPEMFNPYNRTEITDIAPTQTAACGDAGSSAAVLKTYNCTIRKLTPTECWRLMGWKDQEIQKVKDAGISNAQMYKQAGNGIVVTVLEAIFGNLFGNAEI